MASISWKSGVSGDWGTGSDWSTGTIPKITDDVTIAVGGTYTVTIHGGQTAKSLLLNNSAATLEVVSSDTIAGPVTVLRGTLQVDGGQTFQLANLTFGATGNYGGVVDGGGTLATTGTVTLAAQTAGYIDLYLGGGATWVNSGNATIGGLINVGVGPADSAAFVNTASGVFNLTTDYGGITPYSSYESSTFSNAGLLEKTGGSGTGTSTITSYVTNTGSIVADNGTLLFTGGGVFGGKISGAGTIGFGGGSATLNATTFTTSALVLTGGTLALARNIAAATTIGGGGGTTLEITQTESITGAFTSGNANLQLDGGATLTLTKPVTIGATNTYGLAVIGDGTLNTTAAVTLATQTAGYVDLYLGDGTTWVNAGNATIGGQIDAGVNPGETTAFVNQAGATFNLITDYAGIVAYSSYEHSTFTNAGLLEKTGGTGVSTIFPTVTNTGTVTVTTGTINFTGGGTFGGKFTGGGTISFGGGLAVLNGASIGVANLVLSGGSGGGTLEVASSTTVGGGFAAGNNYVILDAGKTLTLAGTSNFGGTNSYGPIFIGGGTLSTTGNTTLATQTGGYVDAYVGNNTTWSNSGTVTVGGQIDAGVNPGERATFVNKLGGVFNLVTDLAGIQPYSSYVRSTFTNGGLLEKTGGTGQSVISSAVTNTGSIVVATGTLAFTGGGSFGGKISGAGTIAFEGGTATVTATTFTAANVLIAGGQYGKVALGRNLAAAVTLQSGTLEATATESLTGKFVAGNAYLQLDSGVTLTLTNQTTIGATNTTGVRVFGPGTFATTGAVTLASQTGGYVDLYLGTGATWTNSGTATVGGYINFGLNPAETATFNNVAGGVFNLVTDLANITAYTSYDRATFNNAGLLEKTGGTGISYVDATVNNTGTVLVSAGELFLRTGITNVANANTITGGTYVVNAGATLQLQDNLSITTLGGTVTLNGLSSVLESRDSGTNAQVQIDASLSTVTASGRLRVLGGRSFTAVANGGTFNDSGTVELGGGTFAATKLVIGAPGTLLGKGVVTGPIVLNGTALASGGTLDLSGAPIAAISGTTLSGGGLGANAASVLQLQNNKTIASTAGSITLNGAGSVIRSLNTGSSTQVSVDSTLSSIANGGALHVLGGRNFTAVASGGTFTDAGLLDLGGGTFSATKLTVSGIGTLSGGGKVSTGATAFINQATVLANTGTLEFLGAVSNSGTMSAVGAVLKLDGTITGNGHLGIGAAGDIVIGAAAAAATKLDFLSNTGQLDLAAPSTFAGLISGFVLGDKIDLLSTAATTETFAAGVLTVKNGATTVASLSFAGSYTTASFQLGTDGHGGTFITHT